MNDRQLSSFIAVADTGAFSKAARDLYISPQALVQQINLLEQAVGAKLLTRNRQGVSLTAAGQVFYDGAKQMLYMNDDLIRRVRRAARLDEVSIAIGFFYMSAMISKICAQFAQQHPEVSQHYIVIREDAWLSELLSVSEGRLDIFEHVEVDEIYAQDLRFERLMSEACACLLPSTHPLANKPHLTVEDLDGLTVGIHSAKCVSGLSEEVRLCAPNAHLIEKTQGRDSAFELCDQGGAFIVPETHVSKFMPLRAIPLMSDCAWAFGLVYRKDPPPCVAQFIDTARRAYGLEGG